MRPLTSKEIASREEFGELCNAHKLTGTAIEIGTHRGEFAAAFCQKWKGKRFIAVDPWSRDYPGFACQKTSEDRAKDMKEAERVLAPMRERMRIDLLQMDSITAAKALTDRFEFVYIDADHHYAHVRTDLELWYPKITPGGILAGHDFNGDWIDDVRTAVIEFAYIHRLQIQMVPGDAASWYVYKHYDEDAPRNLESGEQT